MHIVCVNHHVRIIWSIHLIGLEELEELDRIEKVVRHLIVFALFICDGLSIGVSSVRVRFPRTPLANIGISPLPREHGIRNKRLHLYTCRI